MAHAQLSSVMQFLRRSVGASGADEPTDRQLLARFAARRDEDAFATLARRHGPMVLSVCRRVLNDDHAAEDAFQAAFLVLARKAGSAGWHESVGSWLYEVAYRVALKARSDAARRRLLERQVSEMTTAEVDARVLGHELRAILDDELTRLPEKYRAPLVLCYLEGKTNDEAAAQLGWTKGTVSGRLARARDLLRDRLARRGLALSAAALPAAVTETAGAAVVPPMLLSNTIQAAAAGAVTAPVAALAEGALRTMFWMKWKVAAVVLLGLSVIGTGTGVVAYRALAEGRVANSLAAATPSPQPKGTETKPEEKTIVSKPVRVNGVDFEVVTERRWLAPAPGKRQPVELGLRVTNQTAGELVFYDYLAVHIKSLDGKELTKPRIGLLRQAARQLRPLKLPAGKSLTIPVYDSEVSPNPERGKVRWSGDPTGPLDQDALLQTGQKYNVSLSYQNMSSDKNQWQGQVRTAEVPVEVVEKSVAAATPLPDPERTKTMPEEKTIASKPVRVNGVDFEVVTDRRWLVPRVVEPNGKATARIQLGLRVTNRTDSEQVFFAHQGIKVGLRAPDGKVLPLAQGCDQIGILRPITVGPGKSALVPVGGNISMFDKVLVVWGSFPDGFEWSVKPRANQKYDLSLSYTPPAAKAAVLDGSQTRTVGDIRNVWRGQVRTPEVPVEIAENVASGSAKPSDSVAVKTPLPPPEPIKTDASELSPVAAKWVKRLKANLDRFELNFHYYGQEEKPYYRLKLQVADLPPAGVNPFYRVDRLTKDQATKLIDQLALKGFLDHIWDVSKKDIAIPKGPTYVLSIDERTGDVDTTVELMLDLGWDGNLIRSLEEIRPALEGKAREDMDFLLGRLGVQRK